MTTRAVRSAAFGIAGIGTAISAYLVWVHYSGALAFCVGVGGCETVQSSPYAEVAGLPVALLGLAAFAIATALTTVRLRAAASASTLTGLFGLTLAGALFALYLTYLELFVIHAVCPWCLAVDSAMVALFLLTVVELRGAP